MLVNFTYTWRITVQSKGAHLAEGPELLINLSIAAVTYEWTGGVGTA